MWDWIDQNKEWLFQGVLVAVPIAIIGGAYTLIRTFRKKRSIEASQSSKQVQNMGDKPTGMQAGRDISIGSDVRDDSGE
jgi:hypothetical protein